MALRSSPRRTNRATTKKTIAKAKTATAERSREGTKEAKAAARMTTEQWRKLQAGMAEKWPVPPYMDGPRDGRAHTSYHDETYEIVTLWRAETKICYRPHAKAPGTKSFLRYEKYSRARTVGEALRLGSLPADWCWDYERGFIKVLGPVREEQLDTSKVMDESELTEVDRVIHRWHKRELAKSLGIKVQDLLVGKGAGESPLMRAHRLVAQRAAKEALEAAKSEGRRVTEAEVLKVLRAWRFARNITRLNVLPDGQDWVYSDTLGLLRDRAGDIHLTPPTQLYPEVVQVLNQYLLDRLPKEIADFRWTTINLNCNYSAKLHRDAQNFGPSCIKAFGDFSGGLLKYWPEDDKKMDKLEDLHEKDSVTFDLKTHLGMFNGYCGHYVQPFKGERYTVVFFAVSCYKKAPEERKERLRQLGMRFPSPDEDPHRLLRAPRGYKAGAVRRADHATPSRGKSVVPAFRAYKAAELEKGAPPSRGIHSPTRAARPVPQRQVKKTAVNARQSAGTR